MSESYDKRRRRDLDLFVLALLESGVSTPYELKTAADLSPGATIPALRRLIDGGLVIAAKPGSRGRTDHKITAEGRRRLKEGWRDLIDQGPTGDLDADLRVALLALWVGADRRMAGDFLRRSAARKLASIDSARETPGKDRSLPLLGLPLLASWNQQLRQSAAAASAKREVATILGIAKSLPRRPPGEGKSIRRTVGS